MKLHLPKGLFIAVLAACVAETTVGANPTVDANAATATYSGTDNKNLDPRTQPESYTIIFNMGAAPNNGKGNNYFYSAKETAAVITNDIQIGATGAVDTGLIINNGYGSTTTFSGDVTGSGTIRKDSAGTGEHFIFSGNVSEYTGIIALNAGNTFTLTFGNGGAAQMKMSEGENPEVLAGVAGTGDITFYTSNNTLEFDYAASTTPVYITNAISESGNVTSAITLKGGADYVFTKSVTVDKINLNAGSLTINSSDDAAANGSMIINTAGAGDIILTKNARLSAGQISKATGDLKIQGATLDIDIGNTNTINLDSFTSWTLDNATIEYHGKSVKFNNVTVTGTSGSRLYIDDMQNTSDVITFAGKTTLNADLAIEMKDIGGSTGAWKSTVSIAKLAGTGNLSILSGDNNSENDRTSISILGMDNYRGDISITKETAPAYLNLSGTLNAGTADDATTITGKYGAVINVGAASVTTTLSGNIEFASDITLNSILNIGADSTVKFNGQTLTLADSALDEIPFLHTSTFAQNGVQSISSGYIIANGNVDGITGTVKLAGTEEAQQIINGSVSSGSKNYYIIAESGTQYDKTAHSGIENFGGYVVTNKTTFDLNLSDADGGFTPHLYLDAGTTITNTKEDLNTEKVAIVDMSLLGDATVNAAKGHQYGMLRSTWWESSLSLNSHTLTKTGDGIFHLVNTTVSNGTIDVQEGQLLIESRTAYHTAGTVFNNATVNVGEKGTLNIKSMTEAETVKLLTTTTGTGTIELSQSANLQDGDEMAFEGKFVIKSGADLRIGIAGTDGWGYSAQDINLSKLDSIELAGGTLSTRFYSGNLGDILVSSNSTLHAVDITATNNVKEQMSIGTLSINKGATLTLRAGWKANIAVSQLTGQGSVSFTAVSEDSLMRDVVVQSVNGFTGNFTIDNFSNNKANVTFTVKDGESLNASQIAASDNSSVVIDGAGTYNMGNQLFIAKWNSNSAERGSLADTWTGKVAFSGAAFNNTDLNKYGNAGSTISIEASQGSLAAGTIAANVGLKDKGNDAGLKLTGSNGRVSFQGKVSGGNLSIETPEADVQFTGDVSAWEGTIWGGTTGGKVTYTGQKQIANHIQTGGGNASSSKLDVVYQNAGAMTVAGGISSSQWSKGTVNVLVEESAATDEKVVFTGAVGSYGTVNLTVGQNSSAEFRNSAVQFNDILVEAQAQLSFTGKEALSVSKLEMQQGAAVSVGTIEKPQGTLTVTKEAVFNGGQVQANLTLGSGAKVTMGSALTMGTPTATASETGSSASTGYTLSLEKGLTLKLTGDMLSKFNALTPDSGELVLFTGVNTLVLGTGDDQVVYHVGQELAKDNGVKLSDYIKVEGAYACNEYYIGFRDGNVFAGMIVPEPTTATLSLLALAGLCARRRRK